MSVGVTSPFGNYLTIPSKSGRSMLLWALSFPLPPHVNLCFLAPLTCRNLVSND